jgi:hypothetical protein
MERLVSLCAAFLFLGVTAMTLWGQNRAGSHSGNDSIPDRFVGAWRLASLEEPDAEGKVQPVACTGMLVYSRDGHMSVQVMYRNPPAGTGAAPIQYAQGGYEASFGTYVIDDAHTFTFHVEGALVRALVGKGLKRVYEFSGDQLIVKSFDPKEHWRVVWKRY